MIRDRAVLYLGIAQTLAWAGMFYVFPALLLRWEAALGWSRAELTGAITVALFLSALASPLAGRLIDAGRGPVMLAGATLLGGVSLIGLSVVTEAWQFYLVWALLGVMMGGSLYDPCFALLTRARGAEAKRSIIQITLMAGFASTISFPAAHALADAYDWRVAVRIFAVVVIIVGAPLMWAGARSVERAGKHGGGAPRAAAGRRPAIFASPLFWLLGIGFFFAAVIHGGTVQHLLPMLDDRGIRADVAVLAASFIGPMQVAGRIAVMAAGRHLSNHAVAVGSFFLMAVAMLLLFASGGAPLLVVGFVIVFGAAVGTISIIRPVITHEIMGEAHFGAKFGAMSMLYLAGSAAAPYLASLVWGVGGYDLVLPCLGVLAFLGLGLYLAARRVARGTSP